MPAKPTQEKAKSPQFLFGMAFIFLLCFAIYWPALRGAFLWDDDVMVTANTLLQKEGGLKAIWFSTEPTDYFPLTLTSFWVEWRLFGMNPLGYHVVNVFLHALGAVLLWRVLRQLKIPGDFLIALLFAVHPVGVASAAWIAERKNTLSLVFYLLSLLLFLKTDEPASADSKIKNQNSKLYFLSLVSFLLALLAKTSVVMLPCVLLLCTWWRLGKIVKRDWLRVAPFFLLSLVFGLITIWFQKHRAIGEQTTDAFLVRLLGGGWALWFYLFKALVPLNLTMIYPRWVISPASPVAWLPWLAWIGVFFACWKSRATWGRHALFGLGYFVLTLGPVLGVFDMAFFTYARAADHLQYVSLIGVVALAAGVALYISPKSSSSAPHYAVVAVIALFAMLSWQRAKIFASPATLWNDNLKKNPKAWIAHTGLGNTIAAQGRFADAIPHFQTAISLNPNFADAHNNLGNAYSDLGQLDAAMVELETALRLQPKHSGAANNLGFALAKAGRIDEAVPHYLNAIRLAPDYPHARNNLALAYMQQRKFTESEEQFRAALRLNPGYVEAQFNLANMLSDSGQFDKAIPEFKRALDLRKDHVDTLNGLGVALGRKGDLVESVTYLREALRLDPKNPFTLSNLGLTLAQQKKFAEAIQIYRDSLKIDPNDPGTFFNLANALAETGRADEAAENYRQALQLDPNFAEAGRRLELLKN